MKQLYVIMGVAGCGKTTIGKLLAVKLKLPFYDADDYHPLENIQKMKQAIPLTDTDRWPWLHCLNDLLKKNQVNGCVLACSALNEAYRQRLSAGMVVNWIYLKLTIEEAQKRLTGREGHFMPVKLIHSQFEVLEPPVSCCTVDAMNAPDQIVAAITSHFSVT